MRLTAIVAFACLLALAFAGCSGKDKDGGKASSTSSSSHSSSTASSSSSSSSSHSTTSSSSSTSTGPSNHPPTGSISVSVNGTRGNFTLNGTDEDHDTLVWDLTFGDGNATNGTTFPAVLSHNYTLPANVTAMNFTANFTITDGHGSVTYNVTVSVGGAPGVSQHTEGDFVTAPNTCSTIWFGDLDGVTQVAFEVDPGTYGLPFKATITTTAPNAWVKIGFFDSSGASVGGVGQGIPPTPDNGPDLTGTVPAGAATASMTACGGGEGTAVYDAGANVA